MINDIENKVIEGVKRSRKYILCLGRSRDCKGVMFVLYEESKYGLQFIKILADNYENAVENAKKVTCKFEIHVWNDETFKRYERNAIRFNFGKYKKVLFSEVALTDPEYIFFLARKSDNGSDALRKLISDFAKKHNRTHFVDSNFSNQELIVKSVELANFSMKTTLIDSKKNTFVLIDEYVGEAGEVVNLRCRISKVIFLNKKKFYEIKILK